MEEWNFGREAVKDSDYRIVPARPHCRHRLGKTLSPDNFKNVINTFP